MLDYYGSIPMPSAVQRKKSLIEYAIKHNKPYTEELINRIISETQEYSASGYGVFGIKEEISKLLKG